MMYYSKPLAYSKEAKQARKAGCREMPARQGCTRWRGAGPQAHARPCPSTHSSGKPPGSAQVCMKRAHKPSLCFDFLDTHMGWKDRVSDDQPEFLIQNKRHCTLPEPRGALRVNDTPLNLTPSDWESPTQHQHFRSFSKHPKKYLYPSVLLQYYVRSAALPQPSSWHPSQLHCPTTQQQHSGPRHSATVHLIL